MDYTGDIVGGTVRLRHSRREVLRFRKGRCFCRAVKVQESSARLAAGGAALESMKSAGNVALSLHWTGLQEFAL